jgi:CIC family chloride channel protein
LLMLMFAKILALSLTVSSGGSGGVFAPGLFVGAMLGGCLAQVVHQPAAAFVVVGMATVFAGAARVPMATLVMVTEMTGGYHLLVPAALAVLLSYLVQEALASLAPYQTLYEAQVPRRADSPSHWVEHVQTALRLLNTSPSTGTEMTGHVSLQALLGSGITIDLPDGKEVAMGTLQPQSPCIGTPLGADCLGMHADAARVVALVRQGHVLFPDPETRLQAGDQVVVIASPQAWEQLAQHLAPFSA